MDSRVIALHLHIIRSKYHPKLFERWPHKKFPHLQPNFSTNTRYYRRDQISAAQFRPKNYTSNSTNTNNNKAPNFHKQAPPSKKQKGKITKKSNEKSNDGEKCRCWGGNGGKKAAKRELISQVDDIWRSPHPLKKKKISPEKMLSKLRSDVAHTQSNGIWGLLGGRGWVLFSEKR